MRIAIYQSELGFRYVHEVDGFENDHRYTRVSKITDVEFEMLPEDELIRSQVSSIDGMIEKITLDAFGKIQELKTKRAELLALTHEAAQ